MIKNFIDNIRVVMVETTHPGNIGAAARAMKTMGYDNLYLVKPKIYPNAEATARAAGADDILSKAVVCDSLEEALQGCAAVVASTARPRTISHAVFTPREYAPKLYEMVKLGPVALVMLIDNGLKHKKPWEASGGVFCLAGDILRLGDLLK